MNHDVWITVGCVVVMLALCVLRLRVERREDERRDREFSDDLEAYRRGRRPDRP